MIESAYLFEESINFNKLNVFSISTSFLCTEGTKRFSDNIALFMSRIGISPNSFESSLETVCFPTPGVPETIIFRSNARSHILEDLAFNQSLKDCFKNNH